jgi:hypothetical protein
MLAIFVMCISPSLPASAYPSASVHGLGTYGAVCLSLDSAKFTRDISQVYGVPANQLSFTPDSMLGIQFDASFGHALSGALQIVTRDYIDDRF